MFQHNASSTKHNAVLREKQHCVLTNYYLNKNTHLALCLTLTSTGFPDSSPVSREGESQRVRESRLHGIHPWQPFNMFAKED